MLPEARKILRFSELNGTNCNTIVSLPCANITSFRTFVTYGTNYPQAKFSARNQDTFISTPKARLQHQFLASTGIASLDELLGGDGYPDKSSVLIVGPPGIGKELLVYRFMSCGLSQGEFCFYITKRSVHDVLHDSRAFGYDTELAGVSLWMASEGGRLKFNIDDLSGLSHTLKENLREEKEKKIRIAIDVLSSILMLNPAETIYRFLSQLLLEVKQYDIVMLATLEEGMHPPQVFSGNAGALRWRS